jgi:DNA-binding MarR family transcriptional regulator
MYFSANALARKMEKLANASWKKVDLSPSHAYLLIIVIEKPGVQPGVLANELQLTPSTITRLIQKLEEKKLLVRTITGKVTNVYPTPKAKAMLPEFKQCLNHFYKAYSKILNEQESFNLVQKMHNLADKLPD